MAFVHADRVKETSTTTGTGTYSLAGAVTGFRTFVAGVGTTNRCIYCAENGTDWEINEGVVTDAAPDTLTRARLLVSSTGAAISWAAGTRNLFAVYAAAFQNPYTKQLTSDYTNATTAGTEVTGLSADLEPGTYHVEYSLLIQQSATADGGGFGVNFTGTQTTLVVMMEFPSQGVTGASNAHDGASIGAAAQLNSTYYTRTASTTAPNLGPTSGIDLANTSTYCQLKVILVVTVAGQLELWARSEGTSTFRVMTGSAVIITRTS